MVTAAHRIENLTERIQHLYEQERESRGFRAFMFAAGRWALMLYREYLRDNVKVRAESLAYLMIFSLLPIVAGGFLIFTVFMKFGMVQEAIGDFFGRLLDTIPPEHRVTIQEYTLRFKDAYLGAIEGKSGRLGIFALGVLFWVGLQTFNNIDRTINQIWLTDHERTFVTKVRNFITVAVGAPLVLISSLSVPLILRKLPVTGKVLEAIPALDTSINLVLPIALILATFTVLYKTVPVCEVAWKNAFKGGIFTAVLLELGNWGMSLYFKFGANTAYGKAAVVPLIGFWIYVTWIIVIMGAEVSYLAQNERHLVHQGRRSPTLLEGESLVAIVLLLRDAWIRGENPVSFDRVVAHTGVGMASTRAILRHLEKRGLTLQVKDESNSGYVLARDLARDKVSDLLRDYMLEGRSRVENSPLRDDFERSLEHWVGYFSDVTFASSEK